ncbi:MAG: methyltransferase [bacterium]
MLIQIGIVLLFILNLALLWGDILPAYRKTGKYLLILLPLVSVIFPQPHFGLDYFWWYPVGVGTIIAGLVLFRWTIKQEAPDFGIMPDKLIASGPYNYLRHPLYLSLIFIFVGWWWVWAAAYSFYFGMIIVAMIWVQGYLEEKFVLEKKFGSEFKSYLEKTGMFWLK